MVVRTFARTRKARRLAARPHVEVAACTRDGLPLEAYRGAAASALRGRHAWRAQWLLLRRRGAVLVAADLVYRVRLGPRRWYLLEVEGV